MSCELPYVFLCFIWPFIGLADQPPVFWAEVFNRSDQRWIPIDPVRGIIRKKSGYEPPTDSGPVRMLYVVAFEEGKDLVPVQRVSFC